jgi:transcriptional regulator with XRE-family HTH domain
MTGAELRAIRQELKWTLARLAEYLGVSPDHLVQVERGTCPITEKTAKDMRLLRLIYLLALEVGLLKK